LEPRRRRLFAKVWTEDDVARASALYESGPSLAEVAERLGSSNQTVAAQLRKAGVAITPSPHPKLNDEQEREAECLFRQGRSMTAIAQRFRTRRTTISTILRRNIPDEYAERQAATRQPRTPRQPEMLPDLHLYCISGLS
jgi:IS30 family transposase